MPGISTISQQRLEGKDLAWGKADKSSCLLQVLLTLHNCLGHVMVRERDTYTSVRDRLQITSIIPSKQNLVYNVAVVYKTPL